MSNRSESRSTILPLPSSPHWAPMTAMTIEQRSEIRSQRSVVRHTRGAAVSHNTETAPAFFVRSGDGGCADMLVEHARNGLLRRRANYALFFSAVLEENQSGYSFDSVAL